MFWQSLLGDFAQSQQVEHFRIKEAAVWVSVRQSVDAFGGAASRMARRSLLQELFQCWVCMMRGKQKHHQIAGKLGQVILKCDEICSEELQIAVAIRVATE